jgi:hypothetical protein
MEYMAFGTYFDPAVENRIKLYGNYSLLNDLWSHTLQGGLSSIQAKQMHLEDYFDVNPVFPNGSFEWEGIKFEIVQSVHIMNKYSIVSSYGLMIADPDTNMKIFYTGDTQFCPNQISSFYKEADLIIHDCEAAPYKSIVHANFTDLITLDDDVIKKMILHHYSEDVFGQSYDNWMASAKGAGFTEWTEGNYGFIPKGAVLDTREIRRKI